MSDKKKKGGKKSGSAGADKAGDETFKSGEKHMLDEVTLEIYEAKVRDLSEKMERYKDKCDMLARENDALGKAQAKFTHDKQDIVEFLNIKVGEHEKQITTLEETVRRLELEKTQLEQRGKTELDNAMRDAQKEMEGVQAQFGKAKAELADLKKFAEDKVRMERELQDLKDQLKAKERDYKETIYGMERKVLHDKNQMKKEMLSKVNEAVASFRRVADQQMAETTKRAIRENQAITLQLKKMSQKTMDIITENDTLKSSLHSLKTENGLLTDSERELAKKNQANQRVIKMLVEKLKESDKMLEIAYESGGMDEEGNLVESEERRETEERLEAYENDIQDLQADVEDLQMLNEQMASTIGNVESIVAEMERFLADGEGKQVEDVVRGWKEFLNRMQELRLGPEERESEGSQERIFEERASEDTDSQPHPAHEPQHSDSHDQHHEPPQRPQFRRTSNTWRRNPKTIHPIISAIPTRTPMDPHLSAWVDPDFKKNVGVQTMPMRFGQQTDTQKLLSEVRPWGPPALCLPKKGIGLYLARPVLPPTILAATGGVEGSESVEGRMGGLSPVVSRGAALRS